MRIQKTELAKKLNQIKGVVPKKTSYSALCGILVEEGYLTASNLELTVKSKISGAGEEKFLIPEREIDLINNLPDGEIVFSVREQDTLVIKADGVTYKCQTLDPDLFPVTEALEGKSEEAIQAEMFLKSMKRVSYAVPPYGSNTAHTALCLHAGGGYLNFAGSDGRVLVWDKTAYDGEFELLLPKNTVDRIKSLGLTGDIRIRHNDKSALFFTNEFRVYTRLIDGQYFRYQQMFKELPLHTKISRSRLLDAMVRANMCMEEKRPVKFQFEGGSLRLDIKDKKGNYHETVELQGDIVKAITIGFDASLVLETMKVFECENVKISFGGSRMPMMVEDERNGLKAIVMPVKIS